MFFLFSCFQPCIAFQWICEWFFTKTSSNLFRNNVQRTIEKHPEVKDLYNKAKALDAQADKERSNVRLAQALAEYKNLIVNHSDKLNDTILKEVSERCIERARFVGKFKVAAEVHKKLIERFDAEPEYRNQLAVTYLLGNQWVKYSSSNPPVINIFPSAFQLQNSCFMKLLPVGGTMDSLSCITGLYLKTWIKIMKMLHFTLKKASILTSQAHKMEDFILI